MHRRSTVKFVPRPGEVAAGGGGQGGEDREGGREAARQQDEGTDGRGSLTSPEHMSFNLGQSINRMLRGSDSSIFFCLIKYATTKFQFESFNSNKP